MADQSTFIKLDRNIQRWRWWHDHNTLIVFLVLLLNANINEHGFKEVNIRRGQVACSFSTISQQANLTIQQVRTAFLHLKSTGEITIQSYKRFQVITIVNYDKYQSKQHDNQHDHQHSNNNQSTINQQQYKNDKNIKNEKKNIPPKSPKGDSTPSGGKQYDNLHAATMMPRDMGTYEDIPSVYRDGTYQRFKTWEEYWDWSNQ